MATFRKTMEILKTRTQRPLLGALPASTDMGETLRSWLGRSNGFAKGAPTSLCALWDPRIVRKVILWGCAAYIRHGLDATAHMARPGCRNRHCQDGSDLGQVGVENDARGGMSARHEERQQPRHLAGPLGAWQPGPASIANHRHRSIWESGAFSTVDHLKLVTYYNNTSSRSRAIITSPDVTWPVPGAAGFVGVDALLHVAAPQALRPLLEAPSRWVRSYARDAGIKKIVAAETPRTTWIAKRSPIMVAPLLSPGLRGRFGSRGQLSMLRSLGYSHELSMVVNVNFRKIVSETRTWTIEWAESFHKVLLAFIFDSGVRMGQKQTRPATLVRSVGVSALRNHTRRRGIGGRIKFGSRDQLVP
ncbi:hypothetical protein EDB84DRAFT_1437891 [Lactarius hengduanensis]|nr:hypothetical protein EDB84DRAFT_1437891 [Lactarius hengduanensis]